MKQLKYILWPALILVAGQLKASLDTVPHTQSIGLHSNEIEAWLPSDPAVGVPLIQPPVAGTSGAAAVSFPFTLPEGRQNMMPQVTMSYNSEQGETWLGTGWDISFSSITVDTRWGVPRFDADTESELYLFDGAQLGPVFHRATVYPREADRTFRKRQTKDFLKIQRMGNSTRSYWWMVTDKEGKTMYYGYHPDTGLVPSAVITDGTGNIVEWNLVLERDRYGNTIEYNYKNHASLKGQFVYPDEIYYTGFENEKGKYKVSFDRASELGESMRRDVDISYRTGARIVMSDLLKRCNVYFKDSLIRYYEMDYIEGVFKKTLLSSVSEYAGDGSLFYSYDFDYYNTISSSGQAFPYASPIDWDVPNDNIVNGIVPIDIDEIKAKPTILGGSVADNSGKGITITVGPPFNPASKINSFGPTVYSTESTGNGATSLVDINSDGLPDKLFKEGNSLYYRPNLAQNNQVGGGFGEKRSILNMRDFSKSESNTFSIGFEVNLVGFYGGYTYDETNTTISTYLSDFNGDELVDIAHDGTVYFNTVDDQGQIVFTQDSELTESPIVKGSDLDPNLISLTPEEIQALQSQYPLHDVVRRWEVPYDGRITISGGVRLIEDTSTEAQNYQFADGVIVSIQHDNDELWEERIEADDYSTKTPTNVESIRVDKGDHIYFRLVSVDDGLYDEVSWDPIIQYENEDLSLEDYNGKPIYRYKSSDDFLISSGEELSIPKDGMVYIRSRIQKDITSDDVHISIPGYLDLRMDDQAVIDTTILLDSLIVASEQKLRFDMRTDSEIDYNAVDWDIDMAFISFDDGSDILDQDGEQIVPLCPAIRYNLYRSRDELAEIYEPEASQRFDVELDLDFNEIEGEGYLVAKSKNKLIAKKRFTNANAGETISLSGDMISGEELIFEVYCKDYNDLPNSFLNENVRLSSDSDDASLQAAFYTGLSDEEKQYGTMYRHWGQFVYNGNSTPAPDILDESDLEIDVMESDTVITDDTMGDSDAGSEKFIVMTSDPKRLAWQGSDALTFLTATRMSSTRFGRKNITQLSIPAAGENSIPAVSLMSKSASDNINGGYQVGGGATSWNTTISILDITDMNGDRYPDVVSASNIQYTNIRGGLESNPVRHGLGAHTATSFAFGGGLGGSGAASFAQNAGAQSGGGGNKRSGRLKAKISKAVTKAKGAFNAAKAGVGFSGSVNTDRDSLQHSWMDINGDGLEDKVWLNGDVALNRGYSFESRENWDFKQIRHGRSFDGTFGLGISLFNGSIVGGKSYSYSTNYSELAFMDLNDDALVDIIVSIDPIRVRWNTGNGFTDPQLWFDKSTFDQGVSIGESLNFAGTACVELFFFRICFNPSTNSGNSNSAITESFVDINGDGYPDYLEAEVDDDNLKVWSSKIGSTNMLKSITNPLGGTIEMQYKYEGNSYAIPFSKWVLSKTIVDDGVPGDGADIVEKTFDYTDGRYDRHERQFLGFGTTTEHHWMDDEIVRSVVNTYAVDNVYEQGLAVSSEIQDGQGHVYKKTENKYTLIDLNTGSQITGSAKRRDDLMVFPALVSETIMYAELSGDSLTTRRDYSYDLYGNVLEQSNIYPHTPQDNFKESFEYYDDEERYLKSFVSASSISRGGEVYRETIYEYDSLANVLRLSRLIGDGEYAEMDYIYDQYGNQLMVLNPENHAGERLSTEYSYDEELAHYVVEELDGYGYKKTFQYDYLFGNLLESTDINDNLTQYGHDVHGRPEFIRYPYEFESGQEFSVRYSYDLNPLVPSSLAEHYDVVHDGVIKVYSFSDGLGRDIQTHTQGRVVPGPSGSFSTGYIVSGTNSYDELGRQTEFYHPVFIANNLEGVYQPDSDSVDPLYITYDVLDRPKLIIERDGGIHEYSYHISNNGKGQKLMLSQKTDALGNVSEEYFDLRGNLVTELFYNGGADVVRYLSYDVVSDLLSIEDSQGNMTHYTYDKLGRRISIDYPGTGLTELRYDKAGNLTDRITATIREVISTDGSIRYSYDKERLIQIDYPKYFQNKVQIHYGTPQDTFNRRGRVWLIEDASGGREYFFDVNGHPTKEIRTVMINRTDISTFVSEYSYDSWGRLLSMIYPDGEKLDYVYDEAGKLSSIKGHKAGHDYDYVTEIAFDKFDIINRIEYANGTIDDFYYEDEKGRLFERKTRESGGVLFDEDYSYDLMDNVLNTAMSMQLNELQYSSNEDMQYDALYRMYNASGELSTGENSESLEMDFEHNELNLITFKSQQLMRDSITDEQMSRVTDYQYGDAFNPYRPSVLGEQQVSYDRNGNILLINSDSVFNFSQNLYDEENRLIANSEDGYISRYTYDAFGERALKSHGSSQGIFVNGTPAGFVEHKDNVTVYVSPYFSFHNNVFTKHVYLGDMRIVSKEGTGHFNSFIADGNVITAGNIDYKSRIQQYERSLLEYYASLGIPPGPPTLLGYYVQPEINTESLPDATNSSPYDRPSLQWPNLIPEPDTMGPPGPPVFYEDRTITNETVGAGYGFSENGFVFESQQCFYHYDLDSNTRLISNYAGDVTHAYKFLPSGELWRVFMDETLDPGYIYNYREYDEESGLYYFGDEYFDPVHSLSLSVDAVEQNFGERTYKQQLDGLMFYDYAHDNEESGDFDTEILNSEKPDPVTEGYIGQPDMGKIKYTNYDKLKDAFRDETPLFTLDDTDIKKARRNITFKPIDDEKTVEYRIEFAELNEINQNLEFINGTKLDFTKKSSLRKLRYIKFKEKLKAKLRKVKNKIKAAARIR